VISAGRFYSHGQLTCWDVHDPEKATGIELRDERYGNGRVFEAISAKTQHRRPCDLNHSALESQLGAGRHVIRDGARLERSREQSRRGHEASVGMRGAGRLRLFRYEIRCWSDGRIPDIGEALDSPRCPSTDPECAARILELAPHVPTAVWGRDELGTGDMWNSNSLISWLLASSGVDMDDIKPPVGGRAPGWDAGLVVACRSRPTAGRSTAASAC
jgi:hypothetical protein